jgi:outer membrane protein assembly factor BamA
LRPAAGFRRSGGVNVFHFGLHDANFLGLGKDVEIERVNGVDRTQTILTYVDPALFGSHARLSVGYSNNSDGQSALFGVERPFWRRDERWGGGVRGQTDDRTDSLYALGEITAQFQEQLTFATGWFGKRVGTSAVTTKRLLAGYTYDRSDFSAEGPPDRTLAYPWVGVNLYRDGYVQAHDMDKLGRTEDVNLGLDLLARLGWAAPVVGADRNAAMIDFSVQSGFSPGQGQIVKLEAMGKGRIAADGDFQDMRLDVSSRYYHRDSDARLFFMSLGGSAAANLDPDHQLLLGGDNGLRGYPLRYALGDKSILLTVEERFFLNRELVHLFRIGGAVFADVGKAWGEMPDPAAHLGVLKDVGVGLRIGQTRSAHAAVVRIDVAVPFDMPGGGFHPQILVTTGETF